MKKMLFSKTSFSNLYQSEYARNPGLDGPVFLTPATSVLFQNMGILGLVASLTADPGCRAMIQVWSKGSETMYGILGFHAGPETGPFGICSRTLKS